VEGWDTNVADPPLVVGQVVAQLPGVVRRAWPFGEDGSVDPAVTALHLWEPSSTLEPGCLVALTSTAEDPEPVLRMCAEAGCSAALLREPDAAPDANRLAGLAEELRLPLLWLLPGQPWLPALHRVGSALSPAASADARSATPRGDLFGLADEIAAEVGGPVILEDASFRLLAYSAFVGEMDRGRAEAILGRRIPDRWLQHLTRTGSLDRLRSTSDVVDLVDGPWQARRRLITAVRSGRRQLGVVWVAEGRTPLPSDAAEALRRAVDRAVPAFVRHLERVDAEADRRARLVRELLDGRAAALPAAAEFGFSPTGVFAVLAATSAAAHPSSTTGLGPDDLRARLWDHVALCCESFRRPAAVTGFGRDVLAVVEVSARTGGDGLHRLVDDVVRLAGDGPLAPLGAAISSLSSGVGSLARLRDQAVTALAVVDLASGSRAVRFEDVEAEVLVRDVVARLGPGARLSALDRLVAHDAEHGGELVATLQAYLQEHGSASRTAAALGVHVTTVRHRLARITDVSGARLDRAEVRLALDLLLRRPGSESGG
jgi:DNA-binding PucR family transcriptional regulator